jgi:hypothetical protein
MAPAEILAAPATTWWGERALEPGAAARLQVGPLVLGLERRPREWRVGFSRGLDPLRSEVEIDDGWPEELSEVHRFPVASSTLSIVPATADRPVVSRPENPFHIPGEAVVTIYVGMPLWLQVRLGSDGPPLLDVPIARPSDTWFGPATRAGELCYASRTPCRLDVANVIPRPHRAITRIDLVNRTDEILDLDTLKLPVHHLSLFADAAGQLWTEGIRLVRSEGDEFADVHIDKPPEGASQVARPRKPPPRSFVARAFSGLFGLGPRLE